jgi:hypothetical protein
VQAQCGSRRPGLIRLALAVVLALVATALMAACAGGSGAPAGTTSSSATLARTTAPPPAATTRRTVQPFDAAGALTVTVASSTTGYCWTTSVADPTKDAYRCLGGGSRILDPCFAAPTASHPDTVACLSDPWSPAVSLRLTKPLPADDPLTGITRPWALQLAGGVRCVAVTGTVSTVHGVDLGYQCTDGTAAGAPTGRPPGVLTAEVGDPSTGTVHETTVTTVWGN